MVGLTEMAAAPKRFRGAALLSAAGRVPKDAESLFEIPLLIAAGESDFGRSGSLGMHSQLKELGHPNCRYEEIPQTEHLLMVADALPKVLDFFESTLQKKSTTQ